MEIARKLLQLQRLDAAPFRSSKHLTKRRRCARSKVWDFQRFGNLKIGNVREAQIFVVVKWLTKGKFRPQRSKGIIDITTNLCYTLTIKEKENDYGKINSGH